MPPRKINIRFVMAFLLIVLMINSNYQSSAQSVNVPQFIAHDEVIPTNVGNDLYFRTSPVDSILPSDQHQLEVSQGSFSLYSRSPSSVAWTQNLMKNSRYLPLTGNSLYQTRNTTSDDLQVSYHAGINDLLSTNNGDKPSPSSLNQFLELEKSYYFQFDVKSDQMINFAFLFSVADSGSYYFRLEVADSDGNVNGIYISATNNVFSYTPMFALAGHYVARIYSPIYNAVLQQFAILNDFKTTIISGGISEKGYTGTDTQLKVYQTKDEHFSIIKTGATIRTSSYMGSVDLRAFDDTHTSFGCFSGEYTYCTIVDNVALLKNKKHAFITVTVTPPNDQDPFIQKNKKHLDLPVGFDVDYSFFIESRPIHDLIFNQDIFPHQTDMYDNSEHYRFTLTQDTILSCNASTSMNELITSYDTMMPINFESNSYDVLNNPSANVLLLPAGEYIIDISPNVHHYFTTFGFQNFDRDTTKQLSLVLNQPQFYKINVTGYNYVDSFNFTYYDQLNRSADFSLTYYNSFGLRLRADTFTMSHVYGNDTLVAQENSTLEEYTTLTGPAATNSYLIRVSQDGNILYNSTDSDPFNVPKIATDDPFYVPKLNVSSIDAIKTEAQNNPTIGVIVANLQDGYSIPLNVSKTGIYGYFNFVPQTGQVYHIVITATNITLDTFRFYQWYNQQLARSDSPYSPNDYSFQTSTSVGDTIYTTYEYEFLAVNDMPHGLFLLFESALSAFNASMTIHIETGMVYTLSNLPITSYPVGSNAGLSSPNNILRQIIIGVAVILIVGIPVTLIGRNMRRKMNGI